MTDTTLTALLARCAGMLHETAGDMRGLENTLTGEAHKIQQFDTLTQTVQGVADALALIGPRCAGQPPDLAPVRPLHLRAHLLGQPPAADSPDIELF